MSDDKIHVVLAVYDPHGTYSRHAGVVLVSMFSNTKSPVCVHILHDETLNGDNRKKFIELAGKFGQELNFINMGEHIEKLRVDVDKLTGEFSRGTLYRLFIQDLLPIDKVIYLDCDVVVELDIKEFWDIDLGDNKVGAVLDEKAFAGGNEKSGKKLFFYKYARIDVSKYFSAGSILLNLKAIRDNLNVCDEASEFFRRYPDALLSDMDFMNKIFQNDILRIDRKFNYYGSEIDYSDMKDKLWHLTPKKPWDVATGLPTDALYWQYYAITPWCRNLAADMTEAWAKSRYTHMHSSNCCKTLWQKWKEVFSPRSVTPFYKALVIWHDITYRIRKKLFYR